MRRWPRAAIGRHVGQSSPGAGRTRHGPTWAKRGEEALVTAASGRLARRFDQRENPRSDGVGELVPNGHDAAQFGRELGVRFVVLGGRHQYGHLARFVVAQLQTLLVVREIGELINTRRLSSVTGVHTHFRRGTPHCEWSPTEQATN